MMYLNVAGDACLGVGNCNGGEYSKTAAAYALFYNQLPELKGLQGVAPSGISITVLQADILNEVAIFKLENFVGGNAAPNIVCL